MLKQVTQRIYGFIWDSMSQNNCNTYLIDGPVRVLIDPGHVACFDHVQKGLAQLGMGLDDIGLVICTHAHPDHIEAVRLFKDTSAEFALHEKEWQLLMSMKDMIRSTFGVAIETFAPDIYLAEGDLNVGDVQMQVFHTPGHSPGSVSIYCPGPKALFAGDLVFAQGVGRTDVPGGDPQALKQSLRRMQGVDIEALLPGHGDIIAGGDAVRKNFQAVSAFGL
ncbi:MAG: MBL fold metallo-hydrolase [Thermodesulfobacteriota bacterium]